MASRGGVQAGVAPAATLLVLGCALAALADQPPDPGVLALGGLHALALLRPAWVPGLLALDLAWIGWESAVRAPAGFRPNFDTWMHLALVRRVAENGPFPPDAYFAGQPASPVLSWVHQVLGGAAWLSGVPIEALWRWTTPLLAMAGFGAVYFAHRELFADRRLGLLAALFQLAWRHPTWAFAAYPRNVCHAFGFLCLGLVWRAQRRGGRGAAWCAGVALGLAVASHLIAGAMLALLVAALLLLDSALRWRGGDREGPALALRVVGGSLLAASPWLVADVAALLGRGELPPGLLGLPLGPQLETELRRGLTVPGAPGRPSAWRALLWAGPMILGGVALVRSRERRPRIYVGTATGLVAVALVPPLRAPLIGLLTVFYLSRLVQLLPLSALAARGLGSLLPDGNRPLGGWPRAGAAAAGLSIAALYTGVTPWREPLGSAPPPFLAQPELRRLEPRLRQRVVLTDARTAYLLPYLTGAYVTWNDPLHSNPVSYDAARNEGARAILAGRASAARTRAYARRHAVDFALVPVERPRARALLLRSGAFREVPAGETGATGPRYHLLERVRQEADPRGSADAQRAAGERRAGPR